MRTTITRPTRSTSLATTLSVALLATLATACDPASEGRMPTPWAFGQGELPPDEPEPVAVEPGMSKLDVAELTAIGAAAWSDDVCELSTNDAGQNWYEDDECDWYCPHPDAACDAGAIGPDPVGDAAQYPIVLVHGFMDKGGAFIGLEDAPVSYTHLDVYKRQGQDGPHGLLPGDARQTVGRGQARAHRAQGGMLGPFGRAAGVEGVA